MFRTTIGAHGQFAALPLNLLGDRTYIDFVSTVSGLKELLMKPPSTPTLVMPMTNIPTVEEWNISYDSASVHICADEPIHGVEFHEDPVLAAGSSPLVGDFTSTLHSRPDDVVKYSCIHASGGKILGPAGVTCVIIRDDRVGLEAESCPSFVTYRIVHAWCRK